MTDFDSFLEQQQVRWRRKHVADQTPGTQNGVERPWILRAEDWKNGLWSTCRARMRSLKKPA
jgi:hypothetical protein